MMNYFAALLFFVSLNVFAARVMPAIDAYITVLDPLHLTSVRVNIENLKSHDEKIKRSEINFGDGFVSNKKDVIHQYAQDGVYNITVKIWDNKNAVSQFTKSIDVASNLIFSDGASVFGPVELKDDRKISFSAGIIAADKKYKLILTKQATGLMDKYYQKFLDWYEHKFESKDKEKFEVNAKLNNIEIFSKNEITKNTANAEKFVLLKPENKLEFEIEHAHKNKYLIEIIEVSFIKDFDHS